MRLSSKVSRGRNKGLPFPFISKCLQTCTVPWPARTICSGCTVLFKSETPHGVGLCADWRFVRRIRTINFNWPMGTFRPMQVFLTAWKITTSEGSDQQANGECHSFHQGCGTYTSVSLENCLARTTMLRDGTDVSALLSLASIKRYGIF